MSDDAATGPVRKGAERSAPAVLWTVAAVLVIVVGLLVVVLLRGGTEHLIEVPAGYGDQLEADPTTEPLLPEVFTVSVGDTLRIVNDDAVVHQIGPYTVGPGDTIEQTFTSPGRIEGICTFHPEGEVAILIR